MEDLVKYIVCQLVNNKDDVEVSSHIEESGTVVIEVKVDSNDMGRVIGKSGRIAHAIRTIVKTASNKTNTKCVVKFAERA